MRALDPLWFAKMISDAKSLRISDIHIDVRAWEDKACSIVIRSFFAARGIFDRHRCRRSVDCITATNDGLPEKSPNPPRHVLSHVAPLKFVFELCSLAQECIGEFRSPDSSRIALRLRFVGGVPQRPDGIFGSELLDVGPSAAKCANQPKWLAAFSPALLTTGTLNVDRSPQRCL